MSDDPYCYPGTTVLRNKLGLLDAKALDYRERELAAFRIRQGPPTGDFDLNHLKAIHHHIFQDVYDWAGQTRTLEIAKGGNQFQFHTYIEIGMADVHRRVRADNYLRDLPSPDFAVKAAQIVGDVNYVHPFREGNGRTQLQYLDQLASQAGHKLDLTRLDRDQWLHASHEAHQGRYEPMADALEAALAAKEYSQNSQKRPRIR